MTDPGLRERKKARTRQVIADAAARLFAERGYEQVAVTDVAREAEVSEQTVYNYFQTKEQLVTDRDQLVQDELSRLIRTRAPGTTPAAAIREFVLADVEGLRRIPAGQWRGEIGFLAAISPTVHRLALEMSDRQASALAAAIAETEAVTPEVLSIPSMTMVTVMRAGKGPRMVTEDSSREVWLRQARSYLRNADPVLARLIDDRPDFDLAEARLDNPFGLVLPMDLFGALLFQITGQQLSIPATRRTLARIEALFGGHLPSATELLGVDPAHLRAAGLSWRKIGTLRDLAGRLSDGRLDPTVLSSLPDDEVVAELIAIPGIGPWTVQGALLLLGREDVVVPGDLRVRKAVQAAYRLDHLPTQQEVLAIADKWRPYRSLATSYLFSAT